MCVALAGWLLACSLAIPSEGVWASDINNSNNETVVLSRDTVMDLAVNNYVAVMQSQLEIRSQAAQMIYLNAQRTEAAASIQYQGGGLLPIALEQLKASIPGYGQLTEEEKLQLESALAIQSMINASLNQYIEAQTEQQYAALLIGQQQTLASLDEQIRGASAGLHVRSIEADKVKRLVQFYALQSCYELLLLLNTIEDAKAEADYWEQKYKDALRLRQVGLLTLEEAEAAEDKVSLQEKVVHDLELHYQFRLTMLKRDLGMDVSQSVVWTDDLDFRLSEDVREMDVELSKLYDIRKAEAEINQAESDYERMYKKDRELANYYWISIRIEKDKKALTEKQLEKRLAELVEEGRRLAGLLEDSRAEQFRFVKQREQSRTLLKYGQIAGRELEELDYRITKLGFAVHAAELQYEIWKEKKWAAIQGALV